MTLSYYGHCAFEWVSPDGVRALIDPFGNSPESHWFLKPFPSVEADAVLVTHDHFDHNAVELLPGLPNLLRGPGEFRLRDIEVLGVLDLHSGRSGLRGMHNTIFMVEVEGVRYCHIGDNRHDIPDEVREQLGKTDVLMVTVDDSCHLLSYVQVDSLIERLEPRVVIPMHYYIEGLTTTRVTTSGSPLEPPAKWLATQSNVRHLRQSSVDIARNDLPQRREVWVMESLVP